MSRRARLLVAVLALLACGAPLTAAAQTKVARIGLLSVGSDPAVPSQPQWTAFLDGLRALGYAEGQNLVVDRRFAAGEPDKLPDFAAELVRQRVDVMVVTGPREVQAASRATKTIPIVTIVAPDPVASGLVTSLARPGGNITGLTFSAEGVGGKYVQLIHEAVPSARRLAVLASRPPASTLDKEMQDAARTISVRLVPLAFVRGADDIDTFFARAKYDAVGAVIVMSDGVINVHRQRVVDVAAREQMPVIYPVREFVDRGGLMAYGPSFVDLFRRAATFVDKIVKGARPADLPMEQPTKFELIVNLKTARALGLSLSPILLARADEVLQ
jgi:putative tryptophan/tyrosine transport system substrate-binding protein